VGKLSIIMDGISTALVRVGDEIAGLLALWPVKCARFAIWQAE
jgi:hypothetical protein